MLASLLICKATSDLNTIQSTRSRYEISRFFRLFVECESRGQMIHEIPLPEINNSGNENIDNTEMFLSGDETPQNVYPNSLSRCVNPDFSEGHVPR